MSYSLSGNQVPIFIFDSSDLATDNPALQSADDYLMRILFFTYWNGNAGTTQNVYIDDVVITTDQPENMDSNGNPMIGPEDFDGNTTEDETETTDTTYDSDATTDSDTAADSDDTADSHSTTDSDTTADSDTATDSDSDSSRSNRRFFEFETSPERLKLGQNTNWKSSL